MEGHRHVGDVVVLPGAAVEPPPTPPATNTLRYVVRAGDTLYAIAQAHGTTLREILELNPDLNPWRLRVGDVLLLRGGDCASLVEAACGDQAQPGEVAVHLRPPSPTAAR